MNAATVEQRVEADLARITAKARVFLEEAYREHDANPEEEDLRMGTFGVIYLMRWRQSDETGQSEDGYEATGMSFEDKSAHRQLGMLRMATLKLEDRGYGSE